MLPKLSLVLREETLIGIVEISQAFLAQKY